MNLLQQAESARQMLLETKDDEEKKIVRELVVELLNTIEEMLDIGHNSDAVAAKSYLKRHVVAPLKLRVI